MTRRAIVPVEETACYLGVLLTASLVAVEEASAWSVEQAEAQAGRDDAGSPRAG